MKMRRMIVYMMCCAFLVMTGCADKAERTEGEVSTTQSTEAFAAQPATTVQPTAEPTVAPTAVPTAQPTAAPTAEPLLEPRLSMEEALAVLKAAGIVATEPDAVTAAPQAAGEYIEVEKAETFDNSFVVLTLNARFDKVEVEDIVLKKYSDNWYSLSPSVTNMTVEDTFVTVNEEGKTVIVYKVSDKIEGIKAVKDTSKEKFADLKSAVTIADNYLSWQMEHGGWDKGVDKQAEAPAGEKESKNKFSGWKGKNGEQLGTIDNEATYTQMRHIAAVYREVPEEKYRQSVINGLEFIFKLQTENGGFTQVYPKRGNYSDHVTFNDDAMVNVLIMLEDMRDGRYPFDSDIIPEEYKTRIEESIAKATDFILKAQIETNGRLTAWCAQHDSDSYEPRKARAYELESISGSESVSVIKFLMNQEQTPEIKKAVESAIQWFKDSEVKNTKYDKKDPNGVYFIASEGSSIWYRFYDIETNLPIFCDRDGIKKHNISEIGEERRLGYSWAGTYPKKLLEVYDKYGYYAGRIEAVITAGNSAAADGKTFEKESVTRVETQIVPLQTQ